MSRIQLALNVTDLPAAVDFYSRVFGVAPAKVRPGYANFAVIDPPLKLVLIENPAERGHGVIGALNHLGVESGDVAELADHAGRLRDGGLSSGSLKSTTCCYALQEKTWVHDPDGAPWEFYTVLADAPEESGSEYAATCCGSAISDRSERSTTCF